VNLPQFLIALFEQGRVAPPIIGAGGIAEPLAAVELLEAKRVLDDLERIARSEFPGAAPTWSIDAALWAAVAFYRACQFVLSRDAPAEDVIEALRQPPAPARSAATIYSVDLAFRFLPDLHRLAKSASPDDPLTGQIERWAIDWPYSSVGLSLGEWRSADERAHDARPFDDPWFDAGPFDLAPIVAHAGLLQSYADRVIATGDASRLGDPRVAEMVRAALGTHENLAPVLAAALRARSSSPQ
jgi:hypothetical protein